MQGRGGGVDSVRQRSSFGGHGAWVLPVAAVREKERDERGENGRIKG